MPIQVIAPIHDQGLQEQLALAQVLAQGAQGYQAYQAQQQQDAEREAMAQLLGGAPGQGPKALNPGAMGQQNALMAALSGGPEVQGPPTAPTPGMLPGMTPAQAQSFVSAGAGPALLERALEQRYPEAITPYQREQLEIEKQGVGLEREGMVQRREEFTSDLQLRRDQFASDQEFNRAKLALEERALAQDASTAGAAKLSDIGSFRGQFTGLSEDFIATRDAYGKLRSAVQDPSAAGDVALISGYMRMIDPGSVVREGEYATAANAAGIPEQIRGFWNRLVNGERLTADQRTDFGKQGHAIFQSALQQQEQLQSAYRGIAQRTMPNIDPGDAIPDFVGTAREWAPIVGQPTATERSGQALEQALTPESARGLTFDQLLNQFAP